MKKGENLGYITDIFGNKIEEIIAPESGKILYKVGMPLINKGETLLCLGIFEM